jgi:hypothetical protein
MKRIFTFAIALLSMFATWQMASAATAVFNVTVPTGTNACYIMGNFTGTSWPIADAVKCTKVDATHYTVTLDEANFKDGVTLATIQYKYLSGPGDWAFVEKNADGSELAANRTFTASPTTDVVLKWAAVWADIPPLPLNVTIDVLVPVGTIQCYIVGNFNNWAGPTAPADSCKMVKIATNDDGTMIFEKKIYTADANRLAYHFCSGPDWSFEQKTPTGDYKYPEVAPVVTEWKAVYDPSKVGTINVKITVPAGTAEVFAVGSFQGWSMDNALACTKNLDGTFSFSVPNVMSFEYKLFNKKDNSWGYNAVDAVGADIPNTLVTYPADANSVVTVIAWKHNLSAVPTVNMDNYKIYTNDSKLIVEGVTSQVEVFDISGRIIQNQKMIGKFVSNKLNAGLYIIRVDGATKKVSLR